MNNWIVYKHIAPSNKVYIGITGMTPNQRWLGGKGYKKHPHFFNAIVKYGWENMEHRIVMCNLTKEEAIEVERQLISYYKSLGISYNETEGGDGTKGYRHTEEWKTKCSEWMSNRVISEETIQKRRSTMLLHPYHPSEETKKKIAAAARLADHSKATRASIVKCSKPVYLVDADGNIIYKFASQHNMAKHFNVSDALISKCLNADKVSHLLNGYVKSEAKVKEEKE